MNKLVSFETSDDLMAGLAAQVADDLRHALTQKGRATLAVPGGTTPAPFFDILCKAELDWKHVSVMLTDERFVPMDHPRSNTSLLKAHLLQNAAQDAKLVPFYLAADRPEEVLDQISKGIENVLPLDVVVLGMGTDMHTASLFPDSAELATALTTDAPVQIVRPTSQPEPRLTLTASVLSNAVHPYLLIKGADKLTALRAAQAAKDAHIAPVRVVLDHPNYQVFHAL